MATPNIENALAVLGGAAIIAAAAGGGVSAFGVKIPLIGTIRRQIGLLVAGIFLVGVASVLEFSKASQFRAAPNPAVVTENQPTLQPLRPAAMDAEVSQCAGFKGMLKATYSAKGGSIDIPASKCDLRVDYHAVAHYHGTCRRPFEADEIRLGKKVVQPWSGSDFVYGQMDIADTVEIPANTAAELSWVRVKSSCTEPVDAPSLSALIYEQPPAPPLSKPSSESLPAAPKRVGARPKANPSAAVAGSKDCNQSTATNNGVMIQDCSSK